MKICSLYQRGTNGIFQFKSVLDRNLNAKYVCTMKQYRLHNTLSVAS